MSTIIGQKTTFQISLFQFLKKYPEFKSGFTKENLCTIEQKTSLFSFIDTTVFADFPCLELPHTDQCEVSMVKESSEEKKLLSRENIRQRCALFLVFSIEHVDVENLIGSIGVELGDDKILLLCHDEPGRVILHTQKKFHPDFLRFICNCSGSITEVI